MCDIVHCLEQLHEICDEIVEDIDTLLDSSYVDDLGNLVSNVLNNQIFDYAYKDGSERLKKKYLCISKKISSISKKITWSQKKISHQQKKNSWPWWKK